MKTIPVYVLAILLLALTPVFAQPTQPVQPAQSTTQSTTPLPWWNNRVFYELFVRSFYDSSGDGIGDLQGVIQKLDYLNDGNPNSSTDLGVTGLWLMPIMQSPSYHGYDVTDYETVNSDYGTNDDFKQLIAAAHQHGIAVIVDLVINHTSDQNPWFKASAAGDPQYANWYRWSNTDPGYRGPFGGQAWYPLQGRFYYAIFCNCMPDLNYENPAVTTAMDNIAKFWLQDMGADGFRLDALQHIIEEGTKQANTKSTHIWANAFHQYIQSVNPNALTVGEVDSNSFISSTYVPQAADLTFSFDLATAMLQSANSGSSSAIISQQKLVAHLYPPGQYAAFLTNHDQNRVMSTLNNLDKAKIAADMLMTQPGVPFIYYGEEIGMEGAKPDERIRAPMQWDSTPVTNGFTTGTPWESLGANTALPDASVAAENTLPDSLLPHYRDLIRLRAAHPALQTGDFELVTSASHHVYSFLRRSSDESLLVLINLSASPVSDYGLTLDKSLSGSHATLVSGTGALTQPDANSDTYLPLASLPSDSLTVIQFAN